MVLLHTSNPFVSDGPMGFPVPAYRYPLKLLSAAVWKSATFTHVSVVAEGEADTKIPSPVPT
ncbi:MAG: hypothetical protein A4E42_00353 [Methanoregulaceae archaeon PtaU1.Bin222]|nr:MAG: hypothetical protein A4E42_00353 [Methanoregulaceae archaeon PtaU1.Bin222]